jgi:DNA-binding XRE family transcriptional regulator
VSRKKDPAVSTAERTALARWRYSDPEAIRWRDADTVLAPDLKAYRAKHSLTQSDMALLLGVSRRTLEGWERGDRCSLAGLVRRYLSVLPAARLARFRAYRARDLPRRERTRYILRQEYAGLSVVRHLG